MKKVYDLLIIGGGATGLGSAVDATTRGLDVLLLEQADFAKGTSSRSTKLIHGGLRYLKQGHIPLVREALKERGLLGHNAPHLIHHLPFVVPNYHWWERPFYTAGLKVYDLLAGELGFEPSQHLSRQQVLTRLPTLESEHLLSGSLYYDGQFDDARLAIALAKTAQMHGCTLHNYTRVTQLLKEKGKIVGVKVLHEETGKIETFHARVVLNATGVFADEIRSLDEPKTSPLVAPSQGVHLVFDRSFFPGESALLIPSTEDGRVLFFVPWKKHLLVGTTDTPVDHAVLEPRPLLSEVDFLLQNTARYLTHPPQRHDILSLFAGLRPLVRAPESGSTALLSREHSIFLSPSQLITIVGGKWTTYRKMAQDVIDEVLKVGRFPPLPCKTETLPLFPHLPPISGPALHPLLPLHASEVLYSVREEMARSVEDILARRSRCLFLNARASLEIAPEVARLMASELGHAPGWEGEEIKQFTSVAKGYTAPF